MELRTSSARRIRRELLKAQWVLLEQDEQLQELASRMGVERVVPSGERPALSPSPDAVRPLTTLRG